VFLFGVVSGRYFCVRGDVLGYTPIFILLLTPILIYTLHISFLSLITFISIQYTYIIIYRVYISGIIFMVNISGIIYMIYIVYTFSYFIFHIYYISPPSLVTSTIYDIHILYYFYTYHLFIINFYCYILYTK
jgi:hypothetical protein